MFLFSKPVLLFPFCRIGYLDARFMPKVVLAQYQCVAKLLRLGCVKKNDNYYGNILHMAKERIRLQRVREKKKRPSLIDSLSLIRG